MNKKGVIVIQFNWIYVLVVGSLILALFIGIVVKQSKISETAATGEVQRTLQTILSGAGVKANRVDVIELPNIEIDYDQFGYRVGELEPFDPGITFSPNLIKVRGRQLISWTLDWNAPFRVTNFLFVTSSQVRYVLVGDYFIVEELRNMFPEAINAEFNPQPASFIDNNNYNVKFVFINANPNSHQALMNRIREGEKHIVEISGDEYSGTLKFHDGAQVHESSYMGLPGLIAGIFSDDIDAYNDNMEEAYKKLGIITEVYLSKVGRLADHYSEETSLCYGQYDPVLLQTLRNTATSRPIDAGMINTLISQLESKNKDLQINSCPLLY